MNQEQRKKLFKLPEGTSRITADVPFSLKQEVEKLAAKRGITLMALVREVLAREVNQ